MLCIFAQKLPPLDPTLKIELPPKLQALFDGMLQAAWWDGFYRGAIVGFILGATAAALIIGVWNRRDPREE